MFRFAVKAGLAAGAIYYLKEEGIWKDSTESLKLYDKINTAVEPYVNDIKSQIPVQLPEVPNKENATLVAKQYWNKGVSGTFEFLSELPNTGSTYAKKGLNEILSNEEVRKIFGSKPAAPVKPEGAVQKL